MKKTLILTFVLLLNFFGAYGCCGAWDYHLYPIGELNNEVIFIEFEFSRNCDFGEGQTEENEFWVAGTVNLMTSSGDRLMLLENIDTIRITECRCNYKDHYEKSNFETLIEPYYTKALLMAKAKSKFKVAQPVSVIFNDTIDVDTNMISTDTTFNYFFNYKEILKLDLAELPIISCYPDKVAAVRTFETEQYEITVIRLRCRFIRDMAIAHNTKRFASIETAFWKEQAQWHGAGKDYYVIKNKNP